MVEGTLLEDHVLLEDSDAAREFYAKSRFGSMQRGGIVKLGLLEACYLVEQEKITVRERKKELSVERLLQKGRRLDKSFPVKYAVFRDLRGRGYLVKTALKFGGDFRVYDKGVHPGVEHAKWVVFAVHESKGLTWHDFSAKNRVAHSTRKNLLIGVVDDEDEVSYWEVSWVRP